MSTSAALLAAQTSSSNSTDYCKQAVVALRWAQLVGLPEWVTAFVRVNHLGSHSGQVSLAIPAWVGTMSTSLGWEGNRRSGVALAIHHRQ